jgi:LDH2 family malate/lactate/ureidoglycolate dehydrogenase
MLAQSSAEVARANSVMVQFGHLEEAIDETLMKDYRNMPRRVNKIARSHYISPIVRPLKPVVGPSEDESRGQHERYAQCWAAWTA